MQDDLQAIVELRFRAYSRRTEFVAGAASRASIARFIGGGFSHAQEDGVIELRYIGSELEAYCLMWHEHEAWFGRPAWWCAIDYRPEHPENVDWLKEVINRHPQFDHPDFFCELDAAYLELLPTLQNRQLGIDSVTYLGNPRRALEALLKAKTPSFHLRHMGLEIDHVGSPREIAQILALRESFFRAHPEYCFFGAAPSVLAKST